MASPLVTERKNFQTPQKAEKKKKLYNSIKRLCFYISYKK